jgi:hypothetical protein
VVANQARTQRRLLVAGAVAVPVAIVALYIIASRVPFQRWAPWTYCLSFGVALVSGAFFVWKLVPHAGWRTLVLIAYALGCTGVLFMFSTKVSGGKRSRLTNRWSGRVRDKVPSSYNGARAAQLNR